MADTIKVQDVAKELNEWVANNKEVISAGVYADTVTINPYCRTITAVKGKFPQFNAIISRVVQGFKAQWQVLGETQFKSKKLENFHQKVNFPIIPSEILNTWLADLYNEKKTAAEMPISKWIIEDLLKKVVDDIEDLSQTGVYNSATAAGAYGASLNGIPQIITNGLANATHPMFKIPLDVVTSSNILDQVRVYEKGIPKKTRKKVKRVFVSDSFLLTYIEAYEAEYGRNVNYLQNDTIKTPLLKLEMVALPFIPDDLIFSTVDDNLVRLIDLFDMPEVTDVQTLDYTIKIFMEFWLGYEFLINELVYVAVYNDAPRGLGNAALNALYYDSEDLVIV